MTFNERPGVYTSYKVQNAFGSKGSHGIVGVVAVGAGAEEPCLNSVYSYAEAQALFGASPITELIRLIFQNGAGSVRAVSLPEGAAAEDYTAAFELFSGETAIKTICCDSREKAVILALKEAVKNAAEMNKYRIAVVEASGTASEMKELSEELCFERMVLVNATEEGIGHTAAAVAAAIAVNTDPALPLGGAELFGLSGGSVFSEGEINDLIRGGVTPVENFAGEVSIVRAVTTKTQSGGSPDTTFRELTTILIIDDVVPTIKNALKARFSRTKNTAQTRSAIGTQVFIELENKRSREIIDSFANITVEPSPDDPTVCEVGFDFTVSHGLNRIELHANISV
ncbi:phage tail sheath protein [Clostridiaceae bacterium OttesenSCG-928-D20]|nr:phage tail sheath protein [Clostridiaceae bacterium OttesenSCG-928-D20]